MTRLFESCSPNAVSGKFAGFALSPSISGNEGVGAIERVTMQTVGSAGISCGLVPASQDVYLL